MRRAIFFTFLVSTFILCSVFAGEIEFDEHTIFLLHFNNSLLGESGEMPIVSTGITFEPGLFGNGCKIHKSDSPILGDSLYYPVPDYFNPDEGTIEFWLKPRWLGKDFYVMQAFNLGEIRVQFNIPGLVVFMMKNPDNEVGYYDVQRWTNNEWHHIAATWKIPGRLRLFVDGVERTNSPATQLDLLEVVPEIMRIGGVFPSENVDAVIDEFRLSRIERTPEEIAHSVMAGEFQVTNLEINEDSIRLQPGWNFTPELVALTDIGVANLPNFYASWHVADSSVASVDKLGTITALSSGEAVLSIKYDIFSLTANIKVDKIFLESEKIPADSFLATPAKDHLWEIPVVIVQYFPTLDSTYLEWRVPWEVVTLNEIKLRINIFNRRIKFVLEEGSRYHGYKDSTAIPSLGYRVVEIITIYEHMPMSKNMCWFNPSNYYPDYHQVFDRINGEHYVNNLGVKEFWIWYSGFTFNKRGFELPESNMSSPITGDVSNSDRNNNDLPIYEHTYLVYQFGWELNHAFAIHNVGHQIESMLSHINQRQDGTSNLFIHNFCGMDSTETWITGRCGWTHMPPNTNLDYIYDDTTSILSDCEDWTPDNSGEKKLVNVNTWLSLPYRWPAEPVNWVAEYSPYHLNQQKADAQFYIYWRQNIPGCNNKIAYENNKQITNWWQFIGDWDAAINGNNGLYYFTQTEIAVNSLNQEASNFNLCQNYPNPFNAATTFKYTIPQKSHIRIDIWNVLGQHVITLADAPMSAGKYSINWTGVNYLGEKVSSGIYFVVFNAKSKTSEYVTTRKLLLIQ